jgi:hypothetical protein
VLLENRKEAKVMSSEVWIVLLLPLVPGGMSYLLFFSYEVPVPVRSI